MKRVITYLIVLLIAFPALGQIIQEEHQRPERFKKHKIIDAFKEEKKHKKNNYLDFIVKLKEIQKLTKADDKKELDSLVSSQWDENLNEWVKARKEEFTYDANENVNTFVIYDWDHNTLDWGPVSKFEFTFDANRNLTVLISYYWQFWNSEWAIVNKLELVYDGNNNLTMDTTYFWDSNSSLWVQSYKTEYAYDGNQNMTLETGFEWFPSENKWFYSYKNELTYSNVPLIATEINSYWNYGTSQWDLYSKWEYFYIYLGFGSPLEMEILYLWDENISDWVNENKYDYYYDASENITVDIGSVWNSGTNQWVYYYKDEYTYDGNGNRTLGYYYEWISGNPGEWSNYYYDEFIFDLAYGMNDIIGPLLFEDILGFGFGDIAVAFNNMVIGYRGYEYENQSWTDIDKVIFYYSNYNNALNIDDEILSKSVKLYPNPVDDALIVNSEIPLTKVEVYSILGKKVKEFNTGFNSMRMDNLSNGVYIIRILAEKGSATRKLIKK